MVIDLGKCIGCGSCSVACSAKNNVPQNTMRKVLDLGIVRDSGGQRFFLPMLCNHCENPPCLKVCPTKATHKRADGIVSIDTEKCIGCGYCIVACPYQARTILHDQSGFCFLENRLDGQTRDEKIGVCLKCDFCSSRIDQGLRKGLIPGIDPEATPECVNTCSSGALLFGDLNDPTGKIAQKIREVRAVRLQEDLGTGPSVYYIVPLQWSVFKQEEEVRC